MLPPLNCAGCRTCCLGDTVALHPGDNPAAYKTKLVDGRRVLAKGKDGNCIYLGPKGCTIHGRQPQECRAFDCRKYALMFEGWEPAQQQARLDHPRMRKAIAEGQRRLGREVTATAPDGAAK